MDISSSVDLCQYDATGNNKDILSNLLQDLLIDILCRLPEKDLYKCKSLSHKLYEFITFTCIPFLLSKTTIVCPNGLFFSQFPLPIPETDNPYLPPNVGWFSPLETVVEYYNKLAYSSYLHIFVANGLEVDLDIRLKFIGRYVSSLLPFKHHSRDLLDVCNGLLLFAKPPTCRLYVCNPTTKQCISIPKLCDHRPCISRFSMLAFDPSVSTHYKIVRVPLFEQDTLSLDLDIFSSETGVWVRHTVQLNESNNLQGFSLVKNAVYLDGILYRLLSFNSRKLVSIDLDSVDIHVIDLPVVEKLCVPGCIGVSRGRLFYAHREPQSFHIWYLDGAADWILNYIQITYPTAWPSPYAMHPTDDIMFIGTLGLIFALNLKTGFFYLVHATCALMLVPGIFQPIFVYISCAVPLKKFYPRITQKVLCFDSREVLITDICSDDSEQCANLPEMDKDIMGLSPNFWLSPTVRNYGGEFQYCDRYKVYNVISGSNSMEGHL